MVFSSIYFVFVFLPLTLAAYFLIPKKGKNIVLIAAGLLFYAWGRPSGLFFLLFSVLFNYLTGIEAGVLKKKGALPAMKAVLIAAAVADVVLLAIFKYVSGKMPLGISFYTFTVLSYLFDLLKGRCEAQANPLHFMLYVTFFPKVTSGPIVQYADMEKELAERSTSKAQFFSAFHLFLVGLFKKALLADSLGAAYAAVTGNASMSVLSAWLGMIFYSLQLYFDFSGYSDMAIGLAEIFGFHFAPNFDHPYLSKSIAEFWRRWHISLGNWFKQYVYFPMGGSRVANGRIFLNLLTVWVLTGIWHGNTLNFVFWGLYHGAFVMLERFVIGKKAEVFPDAARIVVTTLLAFIGWVFFFSPSLSAAFSYVGTLFGVGAAGFADNTALFALRGNLVLLVIAFVGCTNLPARLYRRCLLDNEFGLSERTVTVISCAGALVLMVSATAAMLASTYSSFLYFKF